MSDTDLLTIEIDQSAQASYDLLICAAGFESRAIAIADRIGGNSRAKLALGFDHNKSIAYELNKNWFKDSGFDVYEDVSNNRFVEVLKESLRELSYTNVAGHAALRIACDISCFDRYRLACLMAVLGNYARENDLVVDFWYSVAKFEPPRKVAGRNEIAGPIHPTFAGRFADPSRPLALIAGLGYEMGKVVGAAEYLQATRVIAFFPESPITEFTPEVERANRLLLNDVAKHDSLRYPVTDPRRAIATLDSVIRGLASDYNVVLLPGGPKIFVLGSLIAQRMHRQVSVWRVSSGASITARDVVASGVTVGLRWKPSSNPASRLT